MNVVDLWKQGESSLRSARIYELIRKIIKMVRLIFCIFILLNAISQ